jgi:hypothetical protein
MQRTLKRELKVLEIVKREAIGASVLRPTESAARETGRCTSAGGVSASIGKVERWAGGRWVGAITRLLLQTSALGIALPRSRFNNERLRAGIRFA